MWIYLWWYAPNIFAGLNFSIESCFMSVTAILWLSAFIASVAHILHMQQFSSHTPVHKYIHNSFGIHLVYTNIFVAALVYIFWTFSLHRYTYCTKRRKMLAAVQPGWGAIFNTVCVCACYTTKWKRVDIIFILVKIPSKWTSMLFILPTIFPFLCLIDLVLIIKMDPC